jgi:membrane-associated phospholipid phosphatase
MALKIGLIIVLNLWIYGPYLFLQSYHFFPARLMAPGFLDRLIPFCPETVWVYLSIYLLMPIGPALMRERKPILYYGAGVIGIGFVADLFFLFWPTLCARPLSLDSSMVYQMLIIVDKPFHAFPSLHAAFAIYSASCGALVLKGLGTHLVWRLGLWLWAFLILVATLTTKQHVLVDIIAGGILGIGAFASVFGKGFTFSRQEIFFNL